MPRRDQDSTVEDYLKDILHVPLLTAEEERNLARRMKKISSKNEAARRDAREARDEFVRANLRLVISVAKYFAGRGLPLADLIEEGNLGLLKAVEKFDPSRKCRFSTYATWWIRQAIRRGLMNTASTVRVPSYLVEIIAHWKTFERTFIQQHGHSPSLEEVAGALGLGEAGTKIARRAMTAAGHMFQPVSLDVLWADRGEVAVPGLEGRPEDLASARIDRSQIEKFLGSIREREARVLRLRYGLNEGHALTLAEIGRKLNLTRERVRQIERTAIRKLQERYASCDED